MLKKLTAALALMASPLTAQDFSEGSEARSWNLYAEVPAKFEATVVDLLCTFTGRLPRRLWRWQTPAGSVAHRR